MEREKVLIEYRIKRRCVEMYREGTPYRDIYKYIKRECPESVMSFDTFKRKVRLWRDKIVRDEGLLEAANLDYGFTPHGSTVQVNGEGKVVQAWIKQGAVYDPGDMIERIAAMPKVEYIEPIECGAEDALLEIPLFDMHFGLENDYRGALRKILGLISGKRWSRIEVIVGQDLFHNAALSYPRTEKGTIIDKVDTERAYREARDFYFSLIRKCIQYCGDVWVRYSAGNHSETIEWFFFQILRTAFEGQANFDDSTKPRKCIGWKEIFIGYGHCENIKSVRDVRYAFTVEYPFEFARAKVREIHLGHLHREFKEGDEGGIVVRRLSTKNVTDGWSEKMGYVGAHKRFMLFEYSPFALTEIHYI